MIEEVKQDHKTGIDRIDVGIWTQRKLLTKKDAKDERLFESHWLRFEREKSPNIQGDYLLTDIDFINGGQTVIDWESFDLRNI